MMKMMKFAALAAAISFGTATIANATTITVSTFDIDSFNGAVGYEGFVIEDFEETGAAAGEGPTASFDSLVGTFTSAGGSGNGDTCDVLGSPDCEQIAVENTPVQGQSNIIPVDGEWSLNNNDTLGIIWEAELDGSMFDRAVIAIRDAADRPNILLEIMVDGVTEIFGPSFNGNTQLVVIDFSTLVSSATISFINTSDNPDDSFSIDGAALGVVPVPAAGFLLLGGLGGLAALKRRKKAA